MTKNNQPSKPTEPSALEKLLWFTPILGELRDIQEIRQNGRKGFYNDLSTPNISPGEFACNDFLIRELVRYGALGLVTLTGAALYNVIEKSMKNGVVDTLYRMIKMGL